MVSGRSTKLYKGGYRGNILPPRHCLGGEYPWVLVVKTRALYNEYAFKIAAIFVDKFPSISL